MKKRNLWLVLSVIVLAFGMTVIGCDNSDDVSNNNGGNNNGGNNNGGNDNGGNNSGGTAFDGTWVGQVENDNMTLVAANNAFSVKMNNRDVYRGTYTVTGDALSLTFTFVNTGFMSNKEEDKWTPFDEMPADTEGLPPKDINATINGNQFIIEDLGITFTKQ